jgi:hypothetical protein
MKEITGNLWNFWMRPAQVICITTNGMIKNNGAAVMGAGCAKEAKLRIPGIDFRLGDDINHYGVVCRYLYSSDETYGPLIVFPVKHHWKLQADLNLICKSAQTLYEFAERRPEHNFILPRPGCGNGGRVWSEVKPLLQLLPDNVLVITNK